MVRTRLGAILLALLGVASTVTGCDSQFDGVRLRIAGGVSSGVYHALSKALAHAWQGQLSIELPEVLETKGSPDNLRKLRAGEADVAFSAADVASQSAPGPREPRALARIYDDYLHVVVRNDSPIQHLTDLRGRRVAIGAPDSGVAFIARRVLDTAGLGDDGVLTVRNLGLDDAIAAFNRNEIDAFFWSGGLPTNAITELASSANGIRLLDLTDTMPALRSQYPIYNTATIPVSTYNLPGGPVTTLSVPNFLLVTADMGDDVAEALVRGLFAAQQDLAKASKAALSIDIRSAIETDPVRLHPGAVRYYRDEKA